jgi:DNA-binding MarR family transcriptional regulator
MQQISERTPPNTALRGLLARKSLADARQRAAAASLLGLTESDVLAIQHLAWAGAMTPGQLGAALRLTSGGTTALLQRLQRLHYVTREPHPEDRRSTLLRLTPEAERDAGALYAPLVGALDEIAAGLEDDEPAALVLLEAIATAAERHADELARAADAPRPRVPHVPTPGLWA